MIDVMQVCENILRECKCTDGMYRDAMNDHLVRCEERGYFVTQEAIL